MPIGAATYSMLPDALLLRQMAVREIECFAIPCCPNAYNAVLRLVYIIIPPFTVSRTVQASLKRLIVVAGIFHCVVTLTSFLVVVSLTRTIVYGNEVGALSHGS